MVSGFEAIVLETERRVFAKYIPAFEGMMKAGCEDDIVTTCVNNVANIAFPRSVAAMGKCIDVLTSLGVESKAFKGLERVHERVRTYLGVCCVSSVLFVTAKGVAPEVSKLKRTMAKKKLFPPNKKPIVVDGWLVSLLDE